MAFLQDSYRELEHAMAVYCNVKLRLEGVLVMKSLERDEFRDHSVSTTAPIELIEPEVSRPVLFTFCVRRARRSDGAGVAHSCQLQ
jgi:hypothetical protein